jgi:hypothetical protein
VKNLHTTLDNPGDVDPSVAEVKRLLHGQLSVPSRLGYTLLLLAALSMVGVVGALLATETRLPPRTRLAMAVMIGIGLSWAGFASWVLRRRRVLFAEDRVVAARLAVAFTAIFAFGSLGMTLWAGVGRPGYAALAVAIAMLGVAVALLRRARRRAVALSRRRAELEHQLHAERARVR